MKQLSSVLVSGLSLVLAVFMATPVTGGKEEEIPSAVALATRKFAKSTTGAPLIAVSSRGVVYVLWDAFSDSDRQPPTRPSLPLLPERFQGEAKTKIEKTIPGLSVSEKGKWSSPGWLGNADRDCRAVAAWCEGEKLHLLLTRRGGTKTEHVVYDPSAHRWQHVATLPYQISSQDSRRQDGAEMHIAISHDGFVVYLRYNGKKWLPPFRLEKSKGTLISALRVRIALDEKRRVHFFWHHGNPPPGVYGYAVFEENRVTVEKTEFLTHPIARYNFDLGLSPDGKLLLAYVERGTESRGMTEKEKRADPISPPEIRFRYRNTNGWSKAYALKVPGTNPGAVFLEYRNQQLVMSWVASLEQRDSESVIVTGVRYFSVMTRKGWTSPRPCAIEKDLIIRKRLAGPIWPGRCIDNEGRFHLVWGLPECQHCVVTNLSRTENR